MFDMAVMGTQPDTVQPTAPLSMACRALPKPAALIGGWEKSACMIGP